MSKVKRILVTGAGGSPSTNFIRSLRQAPEEFFIIGVDCNKYYLQRSEADSNFLIPEADSKDYLPVINQIINDTRAELIYSQPDPEVSKISENRDSLGIKTFLPADKTIKICQDKFQSYKLWQAAGIKVPETVFINTPEDIKTAFKKLGESIWLRSIVSHGGGKGSFYTDDFEVARAWVKHCRGWGSFTASKLLKPNTVAWLSIWKNGELIVAQGRQRMYWEFGNRAPSGVTGLTGTGITVSDSRVDEIAQKSILAIDKEPNGIFGVDLTYDEKGVPNPTEINIGRFFTTHLFFTEAGLNMPYIFVKAAFDEEIPRIKRKINPLPSGLAWVRGMDFKPKLTSLEKIQFAESKLKSRLEKIKK